MLGKSVALGRHGPHADPALLARPAPLLRRHLPFLDRTVAGVPPRSWRIVGRFPFFLRSIRALSCRLLKYDWSFHATLSDPPFAIIGAILRGDTRAQLIFLVRQVGRLGRRRTLSFRF